MFISCKECTNHRAYVNDCYSKPLFLQTHCNPLESRGNCSATSNNIKLVHVAVDGWAVTFGTARRGLSGAAARLGPSSLYRM